MSKCHIAIDIKEVENRAELIDNAKRAIAEHGGELTGNDISGNFTLNIVIGHIKGDYSIQDDSFILDITHKPLLVSCKRIEAEISKYIR